MTKLVFAFLSMVSICLALVTTADAQSCTAPGNIKVVNDLTASNAKGGVHAMFTVYNSDKKKINAMHNGIELAPGSSKCLGLGTVGSHIEIWIDKSWTKEKGSVDSFTFQLPLTSSVHCVRVSGDGLKLNYAKNSTVWEIRSGGISELKASCN